jgi:acetyltransferase-like isoleucine patch superfamily enzyme
MRGELVMTLIRTWVWMLPAGKSKNKLLRLCGHEVAPSARIGPLLAVKVGRAVIGEGATIAPLNIFRSLRLLELGAGATMGSFNTISAHPGYQALNPEVGTFVMGEGAIVTSRHNIDCSGKVRIGAMSAIAGQRTTILSHEIDLGVNVQSAGQVVIGERAVVLTNSLVLKGAILPPFSLLTANSTLARTRQLEPTPGIYSGSPAVFVRSNPVDDGQSWFERTESSTTTLRIDLPRQRHLTPMSARTAASEGLAVKSERSRP